jgi:hypothetical protein
LNVEMRNVVFQVNIFGKNECTDTLVKHLGDESVVGSSRVDGTVIQRLIHLFGLVKWLDQISCIFKV